MEKNWFKVNKILYDKNGILVKDRNGKRMLFINDNMQLGYNYWLSLNEDKILECVSLLNENPINVLCIGLGGGRTASKILELSNVNKLDIIEINSDLLDILHFFNSEHILQDERVNIIIDDAFNFVKTSKEKYDFITIDIANSPVTTETFSIEFFKDLKNNIFHHKSIGIYWYYNFENFIKEDVIKNIYNINISFENVSYHDIPNTGNGTYFFFSDKYNWNKNKIMI